MVPIINIAKCPPKVKKHKEKKLAIGFCGYKNIGSLNRRSSRRCRGNVWAIKWSRYEHVTPLRSLDNRKEDMGHLPGDRRPKVLFQ